MPGLSGLSNQSRERRNRLASAVRFALGFLGHRSSPPWRAGRARAHSSVWGAEASRINVSPASATYRPPIPASGETPNSQWCSQKASDRPKDEPDDDGAAGRAPFGSG